MSDYVATGFSFNSASTVNESEEIKKLRESLRKYYPPTVRKQIEEELERDASPDDALGATLEHKHHDFMQFMQYFRPSFITQYYGTYSTVSPVSQPELTEAQDVDFS